MSNLCTSGMVIQFAPRYASTPGRAQIMNRTDGMDASCSFIARCMRWLAQTRMDGMRWIAILFLVVSLSPATRPTNPFEKTPNSPPTRNPLALREFSAVAFVVHRSYKSHAHLHHKLKSCQTNINSKMVSEVYTIWEVMVKFKRPINIRCLSCLHHIVLWNPCIGVVTNFSHAEHFAIQVVV